MQNYANFHGSVTSGTRKQQRATHNSIAAVLIRAHTRGMQRENWIYRGEEWKWGWRSFICRQVFKARQCRQRHCFFHASAIF